MKIPSLANIPSLGPVPEGEYELVIKSCKDTDSKKTGRDGKIFMINVQGEELAEPIFHRMWFPLEDEDKEKQQLMWRMFKEFMEGLGMDISIEHDDEDFVGIEFSALLSLTEDQNGRPVNEIKRIL